MALSPTRSRRPEAAGSDEYEGALALVGHNMLVPWYLMSSYAYYVLDRDLLTDAQYDQLCKLLLEKWDSVSHHHKHLIDREALRAGTGFHLAEGDYPQRVVGAAHRLLLAREA